MAAGALGYEEDTTAFKSGDPELDALIALMDTDEVLSDDMDFSNSSFYNSNPYEDEGYNEDYY